ncbi:TIGR03085 family metal-binding protein [Mycobacterium sp. BMJ-28]
MTVARRERAALVATMREAGPDAPTLCEGWTARDLAAHLVVRERRMDAAPGILVPALAGYTAKVQEQVTASNDWAELIDKVASGPPVYSPFILLDALVNVAEMFIHHEDVRRAGTDWQPRVLDDETVSSLARQVAQFARMTLSKSPARVSLSTPDGKVLASAGSGAAVTVTGDPGELLLFAAGREPAQVTLHGDDDAVAAVRAARRGL